MRIKSIVTDIAAIIAVLIPAVFKKKPYCIWYWEPPKWSMKGGPFSARQCKKAVARLIELGMDPKRFVILRKGVEPPKEGPK